MIDVYIYIYIPRARMTSIFEGQPFEVYVYTVFTMSAPSISTSKTPSFLLLQEKIQVSFKWMFPKIGVPQKWLFYNGNPVKMDDLGVPLFLETSKWRHRNSGKSCPGIRALSSSVSGASLWHLLVTEPGRFARDTGNPEFFLKVGKILWRDLEIEEFQIPKNCGRNPGVAISKIWRFLYIILSLKSCRNGWKPPLPFPQHFRCQSLLWNWEDLKSPQLFFENPPMSHVWAWLNRSNCCCHGLLAVTASGLDWRWRILLNRGVWWFVKWKVGKVPSGKRT